MFDLFHDFHRFVEVVGRDTAGADIQRTHIVYIIAVIQQGIEVIERKRRRSDFRSPHFPVGLESRDDIGVEG